MKINIDGSLFDISKVYYVGDVGGDLNWLRYTIRFEDGFSMEIYENRVTGPNMPRKDFIKLWEEARQLNECRTIGAKNECRSIGCKNEATIHFCEKHYNTQKYSGSDW